MTRHCLNAGALLAALIVLSACSTPPATAPASPEKKEPAMVQPTPGAGAAVAVQPAPIVAAPAPSALDKLEAGIKALAAESGVQVNRNPDGSLLLRAVGDAAFSSGRSTLSPSFTRFLKALAASMQGLRGVAVKVLGHTDSVGNPQLNLSLSEARAMAAVSVLASEGLPTSRISAEGRGDGDPVADNATAEGRAANRRVDLLIVEDRR
jgi:outer membrane protein OmpA-like peptidoglycan-associated protein